jgi:hypothetical protein
MFKNMKKIIIAVCILLLSHRVVAGEVSPYQGKISKKSGTQITAQVLDSFSRSKKVLDSVAFGSNQNSEIMTSESRMLCSPSMVEKNSKIYTFLDEIQKINGAARRQRIKFSITRTENNVTLKASSIEQYSGEGLLFAQNYEQRSADDYTKRHCWHAKNEPRHVLRTTSSTTMPYEQFIDMMTNRK